MDRSGRESVFLEQLGQRLGSCNRLHKNNDLVELQRVEHVNELPVFLGLLQLAVILFQAMKS